MTDRTPLTRQRILTEAIAIADTEGVDALTMRRLGSALGVEAMALYNHVTNKDAILDGILHAVLAEIDVPEPGSEWREAMRSRATSARQVLFHHPWAIGLLESRTENSSPERLHYFDAILGTLREAGFDNQSAMRAFSILDAYIFGFILQEASLPFGDDAALGAIGEDLLRQMADAYPHLTAVTQDVLAAGYDFSTEFEFGLEIILDGLDTLRG